LNLGGGFRINLSKRGIGVSGGVKGVRAGLGPRGKRFQISIPGTGIHYRKNESWGAPGSGSQIFRLFGGLVGFAVVGIAAVGLIVWLLGQF